MADKGLIWLIAGSQLQLPMAKEIKRRGYQLLVTDIDPNCECRLLADKFAAVNVYSIDDNLNYARYSLHERPKAVLTAGADAGPEVSAVCEYFGLPAAPLAVAQRCRNKVAMRYYLQDKPPCYWAGNIDTFDCDAWDVYPCVVKANNASGSRGFSVVPDPANLWPALQRAAAANRSGNGVVIEEMLQSENVLPELGQFDTSEIALDFLVDDDGVHYANAALRLFWLDRPGIEAGHFNPFVPDDGIMRLAADAARWLGVECGPFKLDLKKDSRYGWVILEAATRLSGGYDHMYTCPLATGKDITGAMLDFALGLPLDHDKLKPKFNRVACALAPVYKPGKIREWATLAGEQVFIRAQDEIRPLESNADRPVFVISTGCNHREALTRTLAVAAKTVPVYSEGRR